MHFDAFKHHDQKHEQKKCQSPHIVMSTHVIPLNLIYFGNEHVPQTTSPKKRSSEGIPKKNAVAIRPDIYACTRYLLRNQGPKKNMYIYICFVFYNYRLVWIFSQHKAIYGSLAWAAMYCTPFGSSRKFWLKISAQDIAFGRYIYAVHELAPARQSVMFFDLVQHELDSAHKITTISWDPCTAQLTCMFENQSNVDRSRP